GQPLRREFAAPGQQTHGGAVVHSPTNVCPQQSWAGCRLWPMRAWDVAAAIAAKQHLLITAWQLRSLALSDRAIHARVKQQGWERACRGVLGLPGPVTPLRRLASVVLAHACPQGAELRIEEAIARGLSHADAAVDAAMAAGQLVCGRSALWLHGIGACPKKSWIRLPRRASVTINTAEVAVRYGPATGRTVWLNGLPVVDVEQAFMDVAGCPDGLTRLRLHHDLTKLIATAIARRLTMLDKLDQRMAAAPRFVGAPALRRAIQDLKGELTHSATEKKARRVVTQIARKHGLELHPAPFAVSLNGEIVGEADLPVLSITLDIEIDGPHHLLPHQQEGPAT
ncbi:MAG TPA: hypothetical protein VM307_13490, partial [Egibacteraceae bacterium]|nr:hypothetical protein [Egibacteraceae bacterium]